MAQQNSINIVNKGTGAGGANTNNNGLPFEELTDLHTEFQTISELKYSSLIRFNYPYHEKTYQYTKQYNFFKCMQNEINTEIPKAHGCKRPDECYIDTKKKVIFIIEKKNQQGTGSVCEKIQTSDFKLWQYRRTFPGYEIVYIYCLAAWFRENCKAELEYLELKHVPVFCGTDQNYKSEIIDFITNY